MLINLFKTLKETGVPCTLRELLDLIQGLEHQIAFANINDFYYLSRSILVKDEKHYDKFDRAFDIYFKGLETLDDVIQAMIPDEWLRKEFEKFLTEEELKNIKSMGGLEKLLDEFKKDLKNKRVNMKVAINGLAQLEHPLMVTTASIQKESELEVRESKIKQ